MIDAEMQALLSAYAAGTLTQEEEKRLFEKALDNQALFDALADEESMRAALASPLVKQSLLRSLNSTTETPRQDKAPNHWLWIGLAAALFFGTVSVYYWPSTKPAEPVQQVAVATPPPARAQEQPALPERSAPQPKPASAPVVPMVKREAAPELKRDEAPAPPPPATAIKEAAAIADAAPAASGLIAATEQRARNTVTLAKSAAPTSPIAEIFNNNLNLSATAIGHLYAFLIDGNSTQPIATINPLTPNSPRSIPIPAHSPQAEVWLILTPTEDPVLARALTGVLPLPNRPWIKLKTN